MILFLWKFGCKWGNICMYWRDNEDDNVGNEAIKLVQRGESRCRVCHQSQEERELFFALPLLFPLLSLSYFSQLFNCSILLHAKNLFSGKCVSLRSRGGLSKSTSRWAAMFAWFFVSKVNIGTVALDLVDCNISSGWRWIHTTSRGNCSVASAN